jgi:chromate transporter
VEGTLVIDSSPTASLFTHFVLLSLMAVGGGVVMLAPDMQRFVVDARHWITADQFSAAYVLAQAAPGPNMLFVTLIGWQVAGWSGATAATAAILGPPALLSLLVARTSAARVPPRLGRAVAKGLAPISAGMVFATGVALLRGPGVEGRGLALAAAAAVLALRTKVNPVWLILGGAVLCGTGMLAPSMV